MDGKQRISDGKRICSRLACVVGLLVSPSVGCGDLGSDGGAGGTAGTGGADGTGGAGGTSGAGGTGGTLATLFLTVRDGSGGPPLEGASLCEADRTDNCATTNAEGKATITVVVPPDKRISYSYTKEGYLSVLRTDVVDDGFSETLTHYTVTDEAMAALAEELGFDYPFGDLGAAQVAVGAAGDPLEGATFELVPGPGEAVAVFLGTDGMWYRDLPDTLIAVEAAFTGVPPGMVEIRLGGTASNCAVGAGWPGSEPNSVSFPISAGFLTWAYIGCDPP